MSSPSQTVVAVLIVSLLALVPVFAAEQSSERKKESTQPSDEQTEVAGTKQPTASPQIEVEDDDPCHSISQQHQAIDRAFDYLNTKFCQPAIWFDSFFVDDRIEEDARAGTVIRWYNDFSFYEKESFEYRANFKARLNLPGVNKRLKLILGSTEEDDLFAASKAPNTDREREVGLRYDWYAKGRSSFNIQANFKPKIEARWRYAYPFSDNTVARFTQKLYQEKKITGQSSGLDVEHSFNETFLLRWSGAAQYENRGNGWELGSSVQLYQYISNTQAISYQGAIHSVDEPYYYIQNASVGFTYRQNFARDWLFYSVTPEYNWSKEDAVSERIHQVIITFTLEFLFQNV